LDNRAWALYYSYRKCVRDVQPSGREQPVPDYKEYNSHIIFNGAHILADANLYPGTSIKQASDSLLLLRSHWVALYMADDLREIFGVKPIYKESNSDMRQRPIGRTRLWSRKR